ncbi:MAG: hypothetical protein ACLPJJ_09930 [Acidocella sp.]|uniref:hypothetical protein n=1 Tax=Acidocella sp. TaxID=50710 RepID=UPI003FD6F3D2
MALNTTPVDPNDPEDYIPYGQMDLCGNTLENIRYIVELKGVHPVLIGKGKFPYIWLSTAASPDFSRWSSLVVRSTAVHPAARVTKTGQASMMVSLYGKEVLSISDFQNDSVKINSIDLRPIGLNIFGSATELQAGGNTFSGNRMRGGRAFLALG